ncbi:MAG: glycosyltransferase, partial [Selenomonas artemidis]
MAERVNILGVAVDAVTMPEAVAAVEYYMDARAGVTVAT